MKIQKKKIGGGGGGVLVDVYEEMKLYRGDPVGGGGRGLVGSKVGVVGYVQYWGCKPRIEGIVKCT